ncbi:MAG: glutaminase, partial [Devosia sp.]
MQQVDLRAAGLSPRELPVWQYLNALYDRHLPNRDGDLASYIPELAAVDADQFSIAFATTDGFVYEVGDSQSHFTIQSVSKAII